MNKRLEKEFGEHVAEQRGGHWALTSFTVGAWGATEKDTCSLRRLKLELVDNMYYANKIYR